MSEQYFSPSELAFYPAELRQQYEAVGTWPLDAVAISAERYDQVRGEEAQGRVICADVTGQPQTEARPPMSAEQVAAIERKWRDGQLAATDGLVARHRDELETGETTLQVTQYQELQVWRKLLREWPQSTEFPDVQHRPPVPVWIAELSL